MEVLVVISPPQISVGGNGPDFWVGLVRPINRVVLFVLFGG